MQLDNQIVSEFIIEISFGTVLNISEDEANRLFLLGDLGGVKKLRQFINTQTAILLPHRTIKRAHLVNEILYFASVNRDKHQSLSQFLSESGTRQRIIESFSDENLTRVLHHIAQ